MTIIDFDAEMRVHSCPDCSFREQDLSGIRSCPVCLGGRLKGPCSFCENTGRLQISQTPAAPRPGRRWGALEYAQRWVK